MKNVIILCVYWGLMTHNFNSLFKKKALSSRIGSIKQKIGSESVKIKIPFLNLFIPFPVVESQSQCSKSHFPSPKKGKSQFPFYSFTPLIIISSPDKHYSLDSEDDFRSGCRNVSHQQQFFSELPSPGWSHYANYWYSWVQTIYKNTCSTSTKNNFIQQQYLFNFGQNYFQSTMIIIQLLPCIVTPTYLL